MTASTFDHVPSVTRSDVAANLKEITAKIAKAASQGGREVADVTLVAVSKVQPLEKAEKALAASVEIMAEALEPAFATGNYQEALSKLVDLREPVDAFFDNVMVMADDEALKKNRLTLLNKLRNLFLQIADISLLQK